MASNEANKNSEQTHQPNYPTFSGPYPPPPGAYPPPFYTYAPPPEGAGENGGQPPQQYMMFPPPPPGMVYAYPPPGQAFYQGQNNGKPNKRKQVKMACTNCAAACKRCDEARPCERCIKYGLIEQCQDGVRKERKKGIKRGPYKRKNKSGANDGSFGAFPPADGDPTWQPPGTSPGNATAAPAASAPIHSVPQYPPPSAEGYYPYYYPPHGYITPQAQEPHVPSESTSTQPGPNGQPPIQYFSVHPAGFTPYPAYPPPPGVPFTPLNLPHHQQQQTMDPKKANAGSRADRQESEEDPDEEEESSPGPPPTLVPVPPQPLVPEPPAPAPAPSQRKRARAARGGGGEPKLKKTKTSKKASKASAPAKALASNGHRSEDRDPVVGSGN